MLRRSARIACKCPSTSTALVPCTHAAAALRSSWSSSSSSPFATFAATNSSSVSTRSTDSDSAALKYTAPLWHREQWQAANTGKKWRNWIKHSRVLLASANPKTITAPQSADLAPRSLPTPSSPDQLASSSRAKVDKGREMIARYLALRSRLSSEDRLSAISDFSATDYVHMLDTAKQLELHLVENFLLSDIAALPENQSGWPQWLDPQQVLAEIVETGSVPKELGVALPNAKDSRRIEMAWRVYTEQFEIGRRPHLALRLLHFVSAPSAIERPLSFALEVLQDLLEAQVISAHLVQSEPIVDSSDLALRIVLLRTVVASAIERNEHELAAAALRSLDVLGQVEQGDIDLLRRLASSLITSIRETRIESYRPRSDSTIELIQFLLDSLLKRWQPTLPTATVHLLDLFTIELIEYNRHDLLTSLYSHFSRLGWAPTGSSDLVLDFALFISGDAPFRHYRFPSNSTRKDEVPTRYLHVDLWNRFVRSVEEQAIFEGLGDDWTREAKDRWIRHLCHGRIVDIERAQRMYDHWTIGVEHRGVVRPPATPLALSTTTALALADHAFRKNKQDSTSRAFVQRLASDLVRFRTSSTSSTLAHYDLTALARLYSMLDDWDSVIQIYRRILNDKVFPDQKDVDVLVELAATRYWTEDTALGSGGLVEQILHDISDREFRVDSNVWKSIARSVHRTLLYEPRTNRARSFSPRAFLEWVDRMFAPSHEEYLSLEALLLSKTKDEWKKPTLFTPSASPFRAGRYDEVLPSRVDAALFECSKYGRIDDALRIFREAVVENELRSDLVLRRTLETFLRHSRREAKEIRSLLTLEVQGLLEELMNGEMDLIEEERTLELVVKTMRKDWTEGAHRKLEVAEWFVQRFKEKTGVAVDGTEKAMREFRGNVRSL